MSAGTLVAIALLLVVLAVAGAVLLPPLIALLSHVNAGVGRIGR